MPTYMGQPQIQPTKPISKMQVSSLKNYTEKSIPNLKNAETVESAILTMPIDNINIQIQN